MAITVTATFPSGWYVVPADPTEPGASGESWVEATARQAAGPEGREVTGARIVPMLQAARAQSSLLTALCLIQGDVAGYAMTLRPDRRSLFKPNSLEVEEQQYRNPKRPGFINQSISRVQLDQGPALRIRETFSEDGETMEVLNYDLDAPNVPLVQFKVYWFDSLQDDLFEESAAQAAQTLHVAKS